MGHALIGAIIMVHGDDRSAPRLAPQVDGPDPSRTTRKRQGNGDGAARAAALSAAAFSTTDEGLLTLGYKFNEWELRRANSVEIAAEVTSGWCSACLAPSAKANCGGERVAGVIAETLADIQRALYHRVSGVSTRTRIIRKRLRRAEMVVEQGFALSYWWNRT